LSFFGIFLIFESFRVFFEDDRVNRPAEHAAVNGSAHGNEGRFSHFRTIATF
jgi:hypothetical protein